MPDQPQQNNSAKTLKRLRTYQSDVEELMKGGKTSLAEIAAAESDRKSQLGAPIPFTHGKQVDSVYGTQKNSQPKTTEEEIDKLTEKSNLTEADVQKFSKPQQAINEININQNDIISNQNNDKNKNIDNRRPEIQTAESAPLIPPISKNGLSPFPNQQRETKNVPQKAPVKTEPVPPQLKPQVVVFNPEKQTDTSSAKKIIFYIFIFLIIGAVVVGGVFLFVGQSKTTNTNNDNPQILITNKLQKQINVDKMNKDQLTTAILKTRDQNQIPLTSSLTINFVESAGTTTPSIQTADFLNILNNELPGELERSLSSDFVFGFYSSGKGKEPFLVFKTDYYQNVFAGMLEWEKTMKNDLGTIFIAQDERPFGAASSTPPILDKWIFKDVVIKNRDGRILKNISNGTVLLYAFTDKNTVIITTDEDTFQAVWNNLTTGKFAN